jgi:hypothetical protein
VAIAAASAYFFYGRFRYPVGPAFRDVLSATIGTGAAMAGFMLTAASILASMRESWYLQRAREAGVYASLIRYLLVAMSWCLAAAFVSGIGLAYRPEWKLSWYPQAVTAWIFLAICASGATVRVIRIFALLLRLISME